MLIGFVGDLHGHVLEMLAVVCRWQREENRKLNLIVQLGDFGIVYDDTDPERFPPDSYERLDPGQFDLTRMLRAKGDLATSLHELRKELLSPIKFIAGNHDSPESLHDFVDPFGLFEFVPDGTVMQIGGMGVAFVGCPPGHVPISSEIVEQLLGVTEGVDVLASHTGPYGVSRGYRGDVHGSHEVSRLIEELRPRYCLSGDFHRAIGPLEMGPTTYFGLPGITSDRWHPFRGVSPGSLAVLDIAAESLTLIERDWLKEIGGFGVRFDFAEWWRELQIGG